MTKNQTIEWLRSEFIETKRTKTNGEEVDLRIISSQMTQVIVHCIYIALRTPSRPHFGNDFSQVNTKGESLLRIVSQIFNASRTIPNQGEDPLNFLQRNILHAMFEDSQ